MSIKFEDIYYKLPVFFQNWAVSALGLKLKKERFTLAGEKMLESLMRSQAFSNNQMWQYQDAEFSNIAKHTINTTQFYRNWANENKIDPNAITGLKDLALFPVIEKNFLRENSDLFRSNDPGLSKKQFCLHTSGTTGTPLTVWTDKDSRSRHYAFFSRLRAEYGVSSNDKRATLFGRIIMPASQTKPPFWRYDFFQKNLLMSSYHLNEKNLAHYYNKLASYKPAEIFAYPSSIYAIAEYIVKHSLTPLSLKLIMTTAENLLPHQKEMIERAFQAPVVNQYGCTEMAFFCSEFSDGLMKFHPEHGIAEVRDQSGNISAEGSGELIATGFINWSMPVIRYAVGDQVLLTGRDSKGKQILGDVAGRTDDVIYTLDGTPVGRLDPIFKGGNGIKCAQIVQSESGAVDLRLVPDNFYTNQHGNALKHELIKRLGNEVEISITLLETIAKEKNGKFRPVISRFTRRAQ